MELLVSQLVTNALLLPRADSRLLRAELKRLNPEISDAVEVRLAEVREAALGHHPGVQHRVESFATIHARPVPPDLCPKLQSPIGSFLSQSLLLSCGAWFLRRRSLVADVSNRETHHAVLKYRWLFAIPVGMLAMLTSLFRHPRVFSSSEQKNASGHRASEDHNSK